MCYLTTAHNLAAHGQSIAQMEKNILMANPHLAEVFSSARFLYEAPLAISQVNFAPKEQVWDGILLVGDAAGLITPLCGNGMSMSMQAGVLALEQIHAFLSGRLTRTEMEKAYAAAWQQHFKWRTRAGRFIQEKLGGGGAEGLMQVLAALPFLSQRVIRLTHGKPF
ncbi:MAG: hypothetical protein EAZ62_04390 [Sphingobacteriia bacterium]|nr:MAG: hypothetical protein EAZ62_04390 [Sphingobacteriia bacterium]